MENNKIFKDELGITYLSFINEIGLWYLIKEERICEYHNCDKEVTGRKDKKYCCRQHKQSARKRRKSLTK